MDCSTIYQNPRVVPEDLALCYPASYYTHEPPATTAPERRLWALREQLRQSVVAAVRGTPVAGFVGQIGTWLARYPAMRDRANLLDVVRELSGPPSGGRRALDIGCGAGDLLLALCDRGWDATGIEWDVQAADVAHRRTGCKILRGDFRQLDLPSGEFDLVVLKHVIEHLDEPHLALQQIQRTLAPGGRLVLVFPNARSLGARLMRRDWREWDPPRHLFFPTPRALAAAASRVGLVPVRIRTSARHTANILSHSRALRDQGTESPQPPRWRDQGARVLAHLLCLCGVPAGEETIVVLTNRGVKPNG